MLSEYKKYSTTKLLTKERPLLEHKVEYKLEPKLFLPPNKTRRGEGGLRTKGFFKKSYKNKPLISIVTVVYNGEKHLEQTINSVLGQDYDNVEYIVIDGGSRDGTLGIIKKYEEGIDYWASEADSGVYDAMNKGASLCSGEYIAFLNADDWYNSDTIETVVAEAAKGSSDYIFGNVDIFMGTKLEYSLNNRMNEYKVKIPFGHPSLFVKKKYMFRDPFNLNYEVVADYNFILGLIKQKLSYIYIDKSLVNFRAGGISSLLNYDREKFHLYCANFGFLRGSYSFFHLKYYPLIIKSVNVLKKRIHYFNKNINI